jgi:hypothetical protein
LFSLLRPRAASTLDEWERCKNTFAKAACDYFRPKRQSVDGTKQWNKVLISKHVFELWLGIKGTLRTRDRLPFVPDDPSCPLCRQQAEMCNHLFFQCPITHPIWTEIKQWIGLRRVMSTIPTGVKWLTKDARGTAWPSNVKASALATTFIISGPWGIESYLMGSDVDQLKWWTRSVFF